MLTDFGGKHHSEARGIALQGDGKIVAAGCSTDFAVARYTTSGTLDMSFGSGGKVLTNLGIESSDNAYALAVQPDGKIIAAGVSDHYERSGYFGYFALVRYTK
jgi:uncharacterized delta-60 repeat protein